MPTSSAWRTYARNLAAFPVPTTVQVVPKGFGLNGPHRHYVDAVVDLATGRTVRGDPDAKSDDDDVIADDIAAASFATDGSVLAF